MLSADIHPFSSPHGAAMRPTPVIPAILLAALYGAPSFASATPLTTMTAMTAMTTLPCNDAESPHGNGISANVHCLAESDIIAASDDPFGRYVSDIARNHAQDFDGVGPSFPNVAANESLQPTPVPEPASIVLLGSGVVALVARRRRPRRE